MIDNPQSKPAEFEQGPSFEELAAATNKTISRAYKVFGLGLGGLLLFAAFVPLDAGVTAPGTVTVSTKRKPVQHLSGGIIVKVFAKEGQFVRAGDPLLKLDDGIARTNFESAKAQYMALSAMQSRLVAQQMGASDVTFAPDVLASTDPSVQNQIANQRSLFQTRRTALEAEIAAISQQILGAQAMADGYRIQVASSQEQLAGMRDLVAEGYAPRSRELDLRSQLSLAKANLNRSLRAADESRARILQARQTYKAEPESPLMQIRTQLDAELDKFKAATRALVIEAPIEVQQANRLKAGDKVDLQFSSFAQSGPVTVEGRLSSLSGDVVFAGAPASNAPGGAPASSPSYLARISVTKAGLDTLGSRQMQPGMPVSVLIKTGSRTLLSYFLRPLLVRFQDSMKEE